MSHQEPHQAEPRIRTCTEADASLLALIGSATFLESYAGRLPGEAIISQCLHGHSVPAWQALLRKAATQAWLAETQGAPIGYLTLASPDLPEFAVQPEDLELKRIYLFSRFHATGLGQALMETALAGARREKANRLLIGVHRQNERALAF